MAKTDDIAGLLTGISSRPISPTGGRSLYETALLGQQEFTGRLRDRVSGMMGLDVRPTEQKVQEALNQLDPDKPEDRPKILDIIGRFSPERVPALREQFKRKDAQASATMKQQRSVESFAQYLDKTYPNAGYGDLARQGVITPANMEKVIKEASGKRDTQTVTINKDGKNILALIDSQSGDVIKEYSAKVEGTANPNKPDYFSENLFRDGKKVKVLFKREGDKVTELSALGTTELPKDDDDYEKIEVTKDDGQTYVQFYDFNKPPDEQLVFEKKINENRVITEQVDMTTGRTVKYSTLPDGTGKISFGVVKPAEYNIITNDDGTFNVQNVTLGRMEMENVPTLASAQNLIAQREKTISTLHDIDRTIGYVNEAERIIDNFSIFGGAFFHPLMKYVPTTSPMQLEAMVRNLRSRIGRDALMDLRKGSAVGSTGLGALNLKELEMLQAALGELNPAVGDKAFREQLNRVKMHYARFRASLMGQPKDVDWSLPEYREFTKKIVDADGKERLFYKLSNADGTDLLGSDGRPVWYEANPPAKK